MYYIFNSENKVVGWCDFEPDNKDLQSRHEFFIYSDITFEKPFSLLVGKYGGLFEPAPLQKTQEELDKIQTTRMLDIRKTMLTNTDWLVTRHNEQKLLDIPTTLSEVQLKDLLKYRQNLRDITLLTDFPYCKLPELPV